MKSKVLLMKHQHSLPSVFFIFLHVYLSFSPQVLGYHSEHLRGARGMALGDLNAAYDQQSGW